MRATTCGTLGREADASFIRRSVLHAIEGTGLACDKMTITNNQIGPAGNPPNTGTQFKRDTTYTPGQWVSRPPVVLPFRTLILFVSQADGISLACKNSEVAHNFITDTTGAWQNLSHKTFSTDALNDQMEASSSSAPGARTSTTTSSRPTLVKPSVVSTPSTLVRSEVPTPAPWSRTTSSTLRELSSRLDWPSVAWYALFLAL